ncbi:site-specific integrase [Pseudomonas khavaziana]|uniref:site-specific integrase n=1 Tax=Pseudomonas khavaziana TaxID=2842351 RepID=UPI001C3CEDFF|nr:site-specific integrase [Pseudomonas khavaziana]MBV4482895.1 site-specific integrase [Pseudomonas khavaziana]
MTYTNSHQEGRLVLIPSLRDAFASLHVHEAPPGSTALALEGESSLAVFQLGEVGGGDKPDLFNFPYLFHSSGDPWHEANDYLMSVIRDGVSANVRTDDIRRRASKLLDFLKFCESNALDWLDFSGARPTLRPTYKYFAHLINEGARSNQVINQYTAAIYHFYKYVSENWHALDMKRVDTVKQVRIFVETRKGGKLIDVEKRSQTRRAPSVSSVPLGFVREDGEDLRPLSNLELGAFLKTIRVERDWSTTERLILLTSLMTGARKQTVLTIRLKHLAQFRDDRLGQDGSYKLHAGPRTGMDTKYDKAQILYFPKQLADELVAFSRSSIMKKRREKFRLKLDANFPGLMMGEEDMYLFLSDQGNSYYMASSDPRYPIIKSPQAGQVTDTIKRKLILKASSIFPKDFSYHWLRATFAYQLYQRLQPLIKEGSFKPGDDIDFIQSRMHHESRLTTENYLKLFKMTHEKVIAQEIWENKLFNGSYEVLNVEAENQ